MRPVSRSLLPIGWQLRMISPGPSQANPAVMYAISKPEQAIAAAITLSIGVAFYGINGRSKKDNRPITSNPKM